MATLSLQAKRAYCAKVHRSNYAASLRLERFNISPAQAERKLPMIEAALSAIRKGQDRRSETLLRK